MVKLLYNLFIILYPLVARIMSLTNQKARKWVKGRQQLFQQLESTIQPGKPITWVHCSSLGEFEQARPLIEGLSSAYPGNRILITFFSPSGYEAQKNTTLADYVFYLPMDSPANAKRFFDIVNPALVIFIKYEFWYYYIHQARLRNIPVLLASGIFRESQPFFRWYGDFHRSILKDFTWIFAQDSNSASLLGSIGITNVSVTGDTRFDRVLQLSQETIKFEHIEKFIASHPVIVAGSTWSEDDKELAHYAKTNTHIRFIIAPHNVTEQRIIECRLLYQDVITYSELKAQPADQPAVFLDKNVLVIDNIGMLSKLYRYATISYVGGGFGGDGVHNVLEAAVYGKPVVIGPVYDKYIEAIDLVRHGGGFPVENAIELEQQFSALLDNELLYKQACLAAGTFVQQHAGATEKIVRFIQEKRLLTI